MTINLLAYENERVCFDIPHCRMVIGYGMTAPKCGVSFPFAVFYYFILLFVLSFLFHFSQLFDVMFCDTIYTFCFSFK